MMKAAVLKSAHSMDVELRKTPEPKAGELLIQVKACGVCGTDVHIFGGDKGAADNPFPIVLGHEFSGVVAQAGPGAEEYEPGTKVSIDPNVLCGTCYYCQRGIGHFCQKMTGIGTTVDGGFAQYCVVPKQAAYRLQEELSFAEGAMAEPLACCLHGIDMCEIRPGSTVAIIGGGMIGLLMLQLANLSGAAATIVLEPVESKRQQALQLGATVCIDPTSQDVQKELKTLQLGPIETVIECVGKPATIEQAIAIAGNKSVVMMFGLTKPDESIRVFPYEIFKKEIVLKSSFINPYTISRAIALLNQKRVDVSCMVADVISLEELKNVLSNDCLRSQGKFIVDPWK